MAKNTDSTAPKQTKPRRVISVSEEDYRKLRIYAAREGVTITEAFRRIMESSTIF